MVIDIYTIEERAERKYSSRGDYVEFAHRFRRNGEPIGRWYDGMPNEQSLAEAVKIAKSIGNRAVIRTERKWLKDIEITPYDNGL